MHLPQVFLRHSSACNDACLYKVLQGHVIDALGCEHNICACIQHLLDPLLGDVTFPLSDFFKLCRIIHKNLHVHKEAGRLLSWEGGDPHW